MNLVIWRGSYSYLRSLLLKNTNYPTIFFLSLHFTQKINLNIFILEILEFSSKIYTHTDYLMDSEHHSLRDGWFNADFFLHVFSSLKYLVKFNENTKKFLELFVETLTVDQISNSAIKIFNHSARHLITNFSNHFRYCLFIYKFLKNIIKKMNVSEIDQIKFFEQHEILRLYIEKKEIFFLNLFYKFPAKRNRKVFNMQKKFFHQKKKERYLVVVYLKSIKFFKINSILKITIINSILIDKIASAFYTFYFYQKEKIVSQKSGTIVPNVFRFLKKETFLFSIEILVKNFKEIDYLKRIEMLKNIVLDIYTNLSVCIHEFDFLKEFLQLIEKRGLFSTRSYFSKKSEITTGKPFMIKILEKLNLKDETNSNDFSDKKKIFKKISNNFLKDLILSNSLKRFATLVWHFFAFKYLKNALEISWRMQLTRRYTDFFNLNINQSMRFNYKILNFSKKLYKKHVMDLSEKYFEDVFNKKSSNFFSIAEKFFLNYYNSSGLNSTIILKHYNRILALGNLFLLNILRVKKLIKNQITLKKYPSRLKGKLKKKNLFRIFNRKIEILFKNLNNSINFIEIN